tara:strand:- start:10612 stop:11094 length:483 start_codon:yes stop_codon:yes gene_type:complete
MHKFYSTKYIFGFGSAIIVVGADEQQDPHRYRAEAFVGFPKTVHPPRVAFDRITYKTPDEQIDPLEDLTTDVMGMFDEGLYLAEKLVGHFQECACRKSRDSSWLDEILFNELDERDIRKAWVHGYYHETFKTIAKQCQTESLKSAFAELKKYPLFLRGGA